ncbi:MAG: hypothetical protein K6D94_03300, partial [Clostridiales bacterium]|nr:hypothetical protein [Clostridiales bacterium]
IRVTVIDDMLPELQEMGLFSLVSHKGAEIYDDGCTLTLMVTDNDGRMPSEIAFEVTDVYADQDEGKAVLTVKRTGGLNYMLTVSYSTSDGTAEAGKQYVETSGQLAFIGEINELNIEVPLIAEAERPDELDFNVTLTEVLGGGEEELGIISGGRASVHLTSKGALLAGSDIGEPVIPEQAGEEDIDIAAAPGEGEALYEVPEGLNIASVMALGSADSVQAPVYESEPLIGERSTVTGEQNEPLPESEGIYTESSSSGSVAAPVMPASDGIRLRSYSYSPDADPESANYFGGYTFPGSTYKPGWSLHEVVAVDPNNYRYKNDSSHHNYYSQAQNLGSLYTLDSYRKCDNGGYATVKKVSEGLRLETSCEAHTSLLIPNGCSYFDNIMFVQHWTQFGYYKRSALYEARYIFPKATIKIGTETASWDGNCTGEKDKEGIRDLTWGTETFGSIRGGISDYGWRSIKQYSGDISYELDTYPYTSGGASWKPKKDYDYEVDDPPAIFDLEMILVRRVFSNRKIGLNIYTANDEDVINGLSGDPEFSNLTALSHDSPLYGALHPTVSINPTTGGTSDGLIYVGSRLDVAPPIDAGGYSIKLVFLTNSSGKIVSVGDADSVDMIWDNMTEADIKDSYTINVVMSRNQTIVFDIEPSLPPDKTDEESIRKTWALLGSDPKVTIYYTECEGANLFGKLKTLNRLKLISSGRIYGKYVDGVFIEGSTYEIFSETGPYINVNLKPFLTGFSELKTKTVPLTGSGTIAEIFESDINIQGICFNQDSDDSILINQDAYAGDEIIWFKPGHMTVPRLICKFYDSSAKSYLQKMKTQIIQTQVFFDGNGNERIDGWYDRENNLFILDKNSGDINLGFYDDTEIDEYSFAPVYKLINGEKKLCQYFIKVFYNMTPRSFDLPAGHSATETVRVLPAFTSTVTSDKTVDDLTREQTAFRYIQAGDVRYQKDNIEENYIDSSTGHLMYTEAAGAIYTLDIPLGGDRSPAVLVDSENNKYSWTPDYKGNLMFDYDGPEPITSRKNMTLSDVDIAGEAPMRAVNKDGENTVTTYTYSSDGDSKLNGYFGSFYGNSTFAVCVNEKNDIGSLSDINPETVSIGTLRTIPNSDYLTLLSGPKSDNTKGQTKSSGNGDMPEFEVDMGVELPSLEIGQIGLSDYLQVVMDGKSVGFTIGLPLRGYENKKAGDHAPEKGKKDFADSNENFTDVMDFVSACCGKYASGLIDGKDYIKNMFSDAYQQAKDEKGVKLRNIEVQFSVSLAVMFEYNPIDDGFYFQSAGIAASLELAAKFTYRLTVCPIIYFYLKISAEVEVSSGFSVARVAVEGTSIPIMDRANAIATKDKPISVVDGEEIKFTMEIGEGMRGFHATFDGAVYMEVKDSEGKTLNSGKLSSYGEQKEVLLPSDYSSHGKLTILMTALRDTSITSLVTVKSAESIVYWNGVKIAPSLSLEAGIGVGIDVAKVELFLKIALEMELVFGAFDVESREYAPFNMDSFDLGIAIGVNVTLLFFEFSLDLIGYYLHGEQDRNTHQTFWESHWGALNDSVEVGKKSAMRSIGMPVIVDPVADGFAAPVYGAADYEEQRVSIRSSQPKSYSDMYLIRSKPEDEEEIMTRAFAPVDKSVPFQISGYGAGSGAYKLADKLTSGYSYKLFRVGDDNYIVYPRSVGGSVINSVDATQLVMSKVVVTGDNTGLQNPLDPLSKTPYIPVDTYISDDQNTGDLDFDVYAAGSVVTVLFTGYAEQAPAEPLTAA